ncbi:MAG: hyaluronate lyase N-terminal domain-containing protein, partial [Methylophagaceae bacterium]
MATQVQFRRGSTSEHSSFTGAIGEVTVDTDLDTIRVHDCSKAVGIRI